MKYIDCKQHIGHSLTYREQEGALHLVCSTCNTILESVNKKKGTRFDFGKYKTHEDGIKGNPEQWRDAAKSIFIVNNESCLATLGLSQAPSSKEALKSHYRALIQSEHPDKGGSEERAAKINAAFRLANQLYFPDVTPTARKDTGIRPQLLNPITESEAIQYLDSDAWCAQEKKDGKHILLQKKSGVIVAANKLGQETKIPSIITDNIQDLFGSGTITLDGELVNGTYYVFDLLEYNQTDFRPFAYHIRYSRLQTLIPNNSVIKLLPNYTGSKAKAEFFSLMQAQEKEGVVFKRLLAPFTENRPQSGGDMLKCKFWASVSAIVSEEVTGKSSFISYVLDNQGNQINLGRCSTLGKEQPKAGDIVEIRYLYAYKGGKLIQPVLLTIRDDVASSECTVDQLKYKQED